MFLGIEIGGTKLQLGIGPGDGTLVAFKRLQVDVAAAAEGIRRQILQTSPALLQDANLSQSALRGMAFGFGGPVDDATRRVLKSHQVSGWDDFPLAEWAEQKFGLPAMLANDADVAGLAEALFGAGKGLSPIFYVTVGSGIGGGLIIDGEIYRGCGRGAAEIGHLYFTVPRPKDRTEAGSVQHMSSGWGLASRAHLEAATYRARDSILLRMVKGRADRITARHIAQAAAKGDEWAKSILTRGIDVLASGIVHAILLLGPRRIIIGGGVSLIGEKEFLQPLRSAVESRIRAAFPVFAGCNDIVPAALGEEVVVHGALALARRRLGRD